jgi:DNA repair exonuclease SbcCD nuclease subunit
MPPITLLHTADVHLDTRFPSLGDYEAQRAKDFLETFANIVRIALERKVDLFCIAGDLFDSPHPAAAVFGFVKAHLEKLFEAQIPVILIPGTHDNMMASDNVYQHPLFQKTILFSAPILHEPKHLRIKGEDVYLYGMAYHPEISGDYLGNLKRRSTDGIHIGLLHGSIKGAPDWKIYAKDFPIDLEELFALGLTYCALGHYHNRIVYTDEGIARASYPGTPEGKRFRESGPRYVNLIEISNNADLKIAPVAVNTKTVIEKEIDLFTLADPASLVKEMTRWGGEKIIARFILKGTTEDFQDIERLKAEVSPYFSYIEIVDETTVLNSQWIRRLETENTIRGFFVRKMKEKIEQLATSPDKQNDEQKIYKEAFKEILSEFQKREER